MYRKLNIISAILSTVIIITIIMSNTIDVYACFNPADLNAVEVLFNKPGVEYNITVLLTRFSPIATTVDGNGSYVFKYIYRISSGEDLVFGVTLYIERFCGSAPCIEGYNEDKPIDYVLGLRIELLEPEVCVTQITNTIRYSRVETSSRGGCVQKSTINLAFSELLKVLINEGVILGLDQRDIQMIIDAINNNSITAGWNNRLMYSDIYGGWLPYSDLVYKGLIKGVLVKTLRCSYTLPPAILEDVKSSKPALLIQKQTATTVASTYLETQQYQNGLATAIAIAIGVTVALIAYIIWRTLYM